MKVNPDSTNCELETHPSQGLRFGRRHWEEGLHPCTTAPRGEDFPWPDMTRQMSPRSTTGRRTWDARGSQVASLQQTGWVQLMHRVWTLL